MELSLQVERQDYRQHERRKDKRSGPESQDSGLAHERLGGREARHDTRASTADAAPSDCSTTHRLDR